MVFGKLKGVLWGEELKQIPEKLQKRLPTEGDWDVTDSDNEVLAVDDIVHSPARSRSLRGVGEMGLPYKDPLLYEKSEGKMESDIFAKALEALVHTDNQAQLRELCWKGIPWECRSNCWRMLTGYLPSHPDRHLEHLHKKRSTYQKYITQYYGNTDSAEGQKIITILKKDIPRTSPSCPIFSLPVVQKALERLLYIWALQHPAAGYVQGMNDLVTPFFVAFLSPYLSEKVLLSEDVSSPKLIELLNEVLEDVEADCYWCFHALLHSIQDHYTEGQTGIQAKLSVLDSLLKRAEPRLAAHFECEEVNLMQFAYKWVNCLLLRELPFPASLRLWDAYLSEIDDYANIHVYVCLALLTKFSNTLMKMEFSEMLPFLLSPPTEDFTEDDVGELLSQAYLYQQLYPNAFAV
eukprot:TRINITY_DN20590_c0_g1_i2.p1 TRINITY_DN20590_c0_g1~~TRINITY_DN20590_c0_g1_i2.p1  ORF type:complete len:419 (+),score=38.76 TRINITY_DN20590_c0_g1_i2:42-1259(+)